jgi:hypothetical protein
MAFKQEVNVPLIFTVGVVSGIMLLVIVIGTEAWYQSEEITEVAIKAQDAQGRSLDPASPTKTFAELKQDQQTALAAKPHWTDTTKKQRAAIPIEDAIAYLTDHGGKLP